MTRKSQRTMPVARAAILTLAEIAAAMQAFNDGDSNATDTLEAIVVSVDAYRTGTQTWPDAA